MIEKVNSIMKEVKHLTNAWGVNRVHMNWRIALERGFNHRFFFSLFCRAFFLLIKFDDLFQFCKC